MPANHQVEEVKLACHRDFVLNFKQNLDKCKENISVSNANEPTLSSNADETNDNE